MRKVPRTIKLGKIRIRVPVPSRSGKTILTKLDKRKQERKSGSELLRESQEEWESEDEDGTEPE